MWATCLRSASSGYHAEFHEDCYQKHTNPLNIRLSVRIFMATTRTFTKETTLSENGRGAAWHDSGTAWARHGICELAFNVNGDEIRVMLHVFGLMWFDFIVTTLAGD
jgi:hypothetical protein